MFDSDSQIVATAYTNARVAQLNAIVRSAMYGHGASEQYVVGERLVFTSPYKVDELVSFRNREEVRVLKVEEGIWDYSVDFGDNIEKVSYKAWRLTVGYNDDQEAVLYTLHIDDDEKFKAIGDRIAAKAKASSKTFESRRYWAEFWKHQACLARFAYAYCSTTHTTQGSTYENVIVDVENIMGLYKVDIKTRLRSLYVAVTRASKVLVVN